MSQLQKYAWWNLAVVGLGVVLLLAALPFVGHRAFGPSFSVLALLAVGAFILRSRRDGTVTTDERDRQIWGWSLAAGYSVFWVAFVAGCMMPGYIYGWKGAMPVEFLLWYLPAGLTIITVTQSIVILIQYARGKVTNASE